MSVTPGFVNNIGGGNTSHNSEISALPITSAMNAATAPTQPSKPNKDVVSAIPAWPPHMTVGRLTHDGQK